MQATATSVQRSGNQAVAVIQGITHPVNALQMAFQRLAVTTARQSPFQTNLAQIAAQGRRTGAGIQQGALAGASGLRILGVAGLGAFAAIETLRKAMDHAKSAAGGIFTASVGAGAAGMNIERFTAISQALQTHGNVAQQQTQSWLSQMAQRQFVARTTGEGASELALGAARTGANINAFSDTPEEMMRKMAATFAGLSKQEAIGRGSFLGLSPEQSLALRESGNNFTRFVDQAAVTLKSQEQAARGVTDASNRMSEAFGKLTRLIDEQLAPGIVKVYDLITRILNLVTGTLGKPFDEPGANTGPHGAFVEGIRRGLNWLRGGSPATSAPIPPGPGAGHVAPRAERVAFMRSYAASKGLNPNAVEATARGEGLNVYTGDKGTSFGDFQLHVGGGMGDQALRAGVDIRDPNKWKEQDTFAIDQMAANRDKGAAWYAGQWHGAPGWAAAQFAIPGSAPSLPAAVTAGRSALPPGVRLNSRGQMISEDLFRDVSGQRVGASGAHVDLAYMRANAARAAANASSVTNHGNVSVGDVNVYTQATDPAAVAQAVKTSIQRSVTQANTGLE